ncbi:MAG: SurA N-terminal domain-containing protein [Bdellovibrionaceae bacterium]|jgi:peptidyl-prolyl cis-trans isomerase D|nr:SurA N-terminal domain-containing protein [Pseudobdellovibrionaceae bacterium]
MSKTYFEQLRRSLSDRQLSLRQVVAGILLLMIVMVFVFFGYTSKDSLGVGAAAEVNGTILSAADYQREMSRLEQMYSSLFKNLGAAGKAQRDFLKSQAMENLINAELFYQAASRLGFSTSDQAVAEVITQEIEAFKENGKFRRERYEGILQANGWTPADFERQVRKEQVIKRFQQFLDRSVSTSSLELSFEQKKDSTQKRFQWISLSKEDWQKAVKLDPTASKKLVEDPAFRKKLEDEFQKRKAEFDSPEQVRARHILIKVNDNRKEAEARVLIEKIRSELKDGRSFAELAKKYSEDEGSKAKGGDLGSFARGTMVPEFENYAFSAPKGQVSEPIKTMFGWHLIEVLEKIPAKEARLADVQSKLLGEVWAESEYDKATKELEEYLKAGNKSEVERWVKRYGLEWRSSDWANLGKENLALDGKSLPLNKVWSLSSQKPLPKDLIREGASLFLVQWREEKNEDTKVDPKDVKTALAQGRSSEILGRYLEFFKQKSQITRGKLL